VRKVGDSGEHQPGRDESQASQEGSSRCPGWLRKPLPSVVEEAEMEMNSQTESGQKLGGEGDTEPSKNQWNSDGLREEFAKVVKDVMTWCLPALEILEHQVPNLVVGHCHLCRRKGSPMCSTPLPNCRIR